MNQNKLKEMLINGFNEEKPASKEMNLLKQIKKFEKKLEKNFDEEQKNAYNQILDLITLVQILEEERLISFVLNILFR